MFFGAVYDLSTKETEDKIKELTEVFELEDIINTPVKNLSLGQRIRCEIAASLIHNPKILFLDEPTIGLDPVVKEKIRILIKKLNKEFNTTIFLTSHDTSDIEKLCDRVIIVNNGKIVIDEDINHLKYNYLNKKIVEVKLNEIVNFKDSKGITILKDSGFNLKLEIDSSKKTIVDVIKMINPDNIIDINISSVPLEEVISDIYQDVKEK